MSQIQIQTQVQIRRICRCICTCKDEYVFEPGPAYEEHAWDLSPETCPDWPWVRPGPTAHTANPNMLPDMGSSASGRVRRPKYGRPTVPRVLSCMDQTVFEI